MNINPGELNKKIKFVVEASSTTDADGFPVVKPEVIVHSCSAKVTNTSGAELVKANAEFTEVKTRFLIRYTKKEINEKLTIVFGTQRYDIDYMNDYEFSHEYIEVYATRR